MELVKNDIKMALDENSGITNEHRIQILSIVYKESIEALIECWNLLASGPYRPEHLKEVIQTGRKVTEKYPEEIE